MGRRKKRKIDPVETIIQAAALGGFVLGWWLTNSWKIAFIGASIGIVLYTIIHITIGLKRKERLKRSGINEIDSMDGVQFEHYLKLLFEARGYHVKTTATSGDFGADLILMKDGVKTVVQAKRYSKPVGVKAVQEVIPSMKMYGANQAWVVSNSTYTKAAKELAKTHQVVLLGRSELIKLITGLKVNDNPNPIDVKKEIKQQIKSKCEECGSPLLIRNGKSGVFYGCSTFPKCSFTKQTY